MHSTNGATNAAYNRFPQDAQRLRDSPWACDGYNAGTIGHNSRTFEIACELVSGARRNVEGRTRWRESVHSAKTRELAGSSHSAAMEENAAPDVPIDVEDDDIMVGPQPPPSDDTDSERPSGEPHSATEDDDEGRRSTTRR